MAAPEGNFSTMQGRTYGCNTNLIKTGAPNLKLAPAPWTTRISRTTLPSWSWPSLSCPPLGCPPLSRPTQSRPPRLTIFSKSTFLNLNFLKSTFSNLSFSKSIVSKSTVSKSAFSRWWWFGRFRCFFCTCHPNPTHVVGCNPWLKKNYFHKIILKKFRQKRVAFEISQYSIIELLEHSEIRLIIHSY